MKKLVDAITPRVRGPVTNVVSQESGANHQDAAAAVSRDFFLGRWRVDQVFGSLSGNTLVDYFGNGRFEGVDMEVSGNQGQRFDMSGTWDFEVLSTQLFRVTLQFDNGTEWAEKFKIIDRNHIHNIDTNYVAERVD